MGTIVKSMRYGLVAVDGFTKVVCVLPMNNKQVNEIIRGLEEVFATMGQPQQIYNDAEGATNSNKCLTFINKHQFKHIQTSTHAHTAERFVQTFRLNLQRRLDATRKSTDEWTKHVANIVNTYNHTNHNILQIEPNKATLASNFLRVAWHLQNSAVKIKCTEIKTSGYVGVNLKPKPGITKGRRPTYSPTKQKVMSISGNIYLIDILNKKSYTIVTNCYLLNELLYQRNNWIRYRMHTSTKMKCAKICSKEIQYNYLDRVGTSLNKEGLTFSDLKSYDKVGRSDVDRPGHVSFS